jgi:hypothetical protein
VPGQQFSLGAPSTGSFTLRAKPATIAGLVPPGATLALADAHNGRRSRPCSPRRTRCRSRRWPSSPRVAIPSSGPLYFALQRIPDPAAPAVAEELARNVPPNRPGPRSQACRNPLAPAYRAGDLPRVFAEAEEHFRALRAQIAVETPDPFINAAVAALNVGVDAVWDEPQGRGHARRGRLALEAAWLARPLCPRRPGLARPRPAPPRLLGHAAEHRPHSREDFPPPDEASNLARSEAALHSNGDISNSHYDMNTVYIDALFRHLHWTGDLDFARKMWPVIERHLAWERRLFRREYGPEKLPLYEAYAVIWASDDLGTMAAAPPTPAPTTTTTTRSPRLARLLGKDPAPYEKEAGLIARAMREFLWMPDRGMFAEFKDYLGLQRLHPSAALWSFYHTMDAGLVSPPRPSAWRTMWTLTCRTSRCRSGRPHR